MAAPKPKPPPKRSWWRDKKKIIHCYANPADDCSYHIVSLPQSSAAYDAELGRATKEINGILDELADKNSPSRKASLILVNSGVFLTWTQPSRGGPDEPGAIGPGDDPAKIQKALSLTMSRRKKPKPPKPKPRDYILGSSGTAYCYPSNRSRCVLGRLWESDDVAPGGFHDSDMAEATLQVNAILDFVSNGQDPRRSPSFIAIGGALALVWTEPGIGPDDDPQDIRQALGLRS